MDSACVFEQGTVIHELTQGIEMAKQLRLNLNSPEAKAFFIHNILSSYDKALFLLQSAGQPRATHLPESSLPKSSISTGSLQSTEYEFAQNVVSKKRKASSPTPSPVFEITYKRIQTCNNVAQSVPPSPPSPEKYETTPTNHYHHHELSSPNPDEILLNVNDNLSVNTWDVDASTPSLFSFPSTPFGFSDDDFEPVNFPSDLDDELFQGNSAPFISTTASESNYHTDYWGCSSTLMDFPTEPVDLYPDFEFNNYFYDR